MRRRFAIVAGLACLLLGAFAHAERATERYAPTQIFVARDFLERARAAASLEEYATARAYARQAELDARIAWGMTDAAPLRAEAAQIASQAAALATAGASGAPDVSMPDQGRVTALTQCRMGTFSPSVSCR